MQSLEIWTFYYQKIVCNPFDNGVCDYKDYDNNGIHNRKGTRNQNRTNKRCNQKNEYYTICSP